MPISIDFLANTRDVLRGTKDLEGALEGVASSLDDVSKEGKRTGEVLGDEISDGAKEAESGVERLERTFKELADTAKRETKSSGDAVRTNIRSGTDGAREGVRELRDESVNTAREAAASFDGSAASIGSAFQEVAANAFAGFGPAGVAAGLAAAAGIGLIIAATEEGQEQTVAFRERVSELTQELIEAGQQGGRPLEDLVSKIKVLASEAEEGKTSLADLRKIAELGGYDFNELTNIYAENGEAASELVEKSKLLINAWQSESLAASESGSTISTEASNKYQAAQLIVEAFESEVKAAKEAAEAEANYAETDVAALEAKAELINAINDAYDNSAGAIDDYLNKEGKLLDTKKYIAAMRTKRRELAHFQEDLAAADLSPEAKEFLVSQGAEAASQFLTGYGKASEEQKTQLNAIWSAAGEENSGEYVASIAAGMPKRIPSPKLAKPDTSEAEKALTDWAKKPRTLTVKVKAVDQYGREIK